MDTPAPKASITVPAAPANEDTRYYVCDHLGTARVVMDAAGAVVERHDFEPFGVEIMPYQNIADNSHQYTGQERDAATQMDYMHFRYYGSNLGRFMKPDNVVGNAMNPQDWNLYSYVHGNPVNFNDPTGHLYKPPNRNWLKLDGAGGYHGYEEALGDASLFGMQFAQWAYSLSRPTTAWNVYQQNSNGTFSLVGVALGTTSLSHSVVVEHVKSFQPFGHAVISVDSTRPIGLVPNSDVEEASAFLRELSNLLPEPVPGHIAVSSAKMKEKISLFVSSVAAKRMNAYISRAKQVPQIYDALYRNCVQFVEEVLRAGSVWTPNDILPASLVADLKRHYTP